MAPKRKSSSAPKPSPLAVQVKARIVALNLAQSRVAAAAELMPHNLSRFLNGRAQLQHHGLERLLKVVGLEVVESAAPVSMACRRKTRNFNAEAAETAKEDGFPFL